MGYQQGGPPQGYQPAPQPQPIDFNALLAKLSRGDMVIGGSLLLLFIFSFIGGWFHLSFDNTSLGIVSGGSVTYGSLWGGLGVLAALLIVAAIAFYVIRLIPQVQLPALPLPDWQIWMVFGIGEIVLFFLNWLIGKGSYNGVDLGEFTGSKFPGWAFFVGVILAAAIAAGGYLKQSDPAPAAAGGGSGGFGGGYPQQGYAAPEQPAYPAQQPYPAPQQQQAPPQQPGYGAPPPQGYPQQGGYPPQQPPSGYPPQQ